jgi:hypothetical protein
MEKGEMSVPENFVGIAIANATDNILADQNIVSLKIMEQLNSVIYNGIKK